MAGGGQGTGEPGPIQSDRIAGPAARDTVRKSSGWSVAERLIPTGCIGTDTSRIVSGMVGIGRSHEMSRCAAISQGAEPGDLVMGDRGLSSYAHLAILAGRDVHGLFRLHQRRGVDAGPVRVRAGAREFDSPAGLPGSLWTPVRGESDQIVVWYKPKIKPTWMSAKEYAALPAELTVRVLRYRVESPGFRVGEVTVVTTLLDAAAYPAEEVAMLDFRRWLVEVNFKHINIIMNMDSLRCETVDGVLKELAIFALVYNLVRSVTSESARAQGVAPERISVIDTIRWLIGPEGDGDVTVLKVNPARPGRVEPRVVKRRPKQYYRMTIPGSELRKKLPMKGF